MNLFADDIHHVVAGNKRILRALAPSTNFTLLLVSELTFRPLCSLSNICNLQQASQKNLDPVKTFGCSDNQMKFEKIKCTFGKRKDSSLSPRSHFSLEQQ